MRTCVCGSAIKDGDALCAHCEALHELGLADGASLDEVKAAYKTLVKVWHPDRFQSDPKVRQAAEAKLRAINAAFASLTAEGYRGGWGRQADASQGPVSGAAAEWPTVETRMQDSTQGPARERAATVRRGGATGSGQRLATRLLVLAMVLGIAAFFFNLADSYVAADPTMGRNYVGFKLKLKSDFEAAGQRTWGELEGRLHGIFGGGSGAAPVAAPQVGEPAAAAADAAATPSAAKHGGVKAPATPMRLLPYVTVGMTREEVESAQGPPTSSSNDKLMYGSSEVDLKDGKVVGWKVDSRSPLRVKLWPDGPVDTSLRFFTIGSTKDEVLSVQGTPTSFSADRFDYGSSSVYFRDKWVVGWKNEPGSVPLRAER